MNQPARTAKTNRLLIPCVLVIGLLAAGGMIYWRRSLTETNLLAAGRNGVTRALHRQGVSQADLVLAVPTSRRALKTGEVELTYNLTVDRAWAEHPQIGRRNLGYTGQLAVPMTVILHQSGYPDVLGFDRPMWAVKEALIVRTPEVAEEIWSRLSDNPKNATFDNQLFVSPGSECSSLVIYFASAVRSESYETAAHYFDNPNAWSSSEGWTPVWARRVKGEMDRLQSALDDGKIAPPHNAAIKKGLNDFAHAPRFQAFREIYIPLLSE